MTAPRKSLLLLDSAPQPEWNLKELLEARTHRPWEIWQPDSHFSDREWKKKVKFFLFPFKLLFHRREIGTILSYQQFYGLFFAFYCELFHVKKCCRLFISTFIYRPKAGIAGWLYFRFMRRAVCSRAVDRIICYSAGEPAYYQALFNAPAGRFASVPLGLGDALHGGVPFTEPPAEPFILAAGQSNRDYAFLTSALGGTAYQTIVLCGSCPCSSAPNIHVFRDRYGKAYYDLLAGCSCVVIPLRDARISSGQLALLEAMMFAKPVLATRTSTTAEYIRDGETGFLFSTQEELLARLHELFSQPALSHQIAQNGRRAFVQEHSLERMADALSVLLCQTEEQTP